MRSSPISSNDRISPENLICNICQSIFVEPVLLPCGHGFCRSCFNGVLEFNALTCPCCRRRFGNWLRKADKTNTVVDQALWTYIQTNHRDELEKENAQPLTNIKLRRNPERGNIRRAATGRNPSQCNALGASSTSADATTACNSITTQTPTATALTAGHNKKVAPQLSQPGEIRKEYEAQLERFQKEIENERQNELKASTEYIKQLFEEDLTQLQQHQPPNTSCANISNETMLVANPGHPSYALKSTTNPNNLPSISSSEAKKNAIGASSSGTATSSTSSASCHNHNNTAATATQQSTASFLAQSAKCNLIKTLAVRLNRGTDIIKQSVHKAIISKIPQNFLSGTTNNREILTVPPTNTHRSPHRNTNSADSLRLEMCHFKPIRTAPTTPSKKNTEAILRTPKAKRIVKLKLDDEGNSRAPDVKSSFLRQSLLQSPRRSAFILVGSCAPSTSQAAESNSRLVDEVADNLKYEIINKKCVVLLKRLNLDINNAKHLRKMKLQNHRPNGLLKNSARRYKYRNYQIYDSSLIELDKYERLIKEQQRCEELIAQERKDYELAKKLQAEINRNTTQVTESVSLRKRKSHESARDVRLAKHSNHNGEQDCGPSTSKKPCRRTCGRTVAFQETEQVAGGKKTRIASKGTNLRRSTRAAKPTRRYFQ